MFTFSFYWKFYRFVNKEFTYFTNKIDKKTEDIEIKVRQNESKITSSFSIVLIDDMIIIIAIMIIFRIKQRMIKGMNHSIKIQQLYIIVFIKQLKLAH